MFSSVSPRTMSSSTYWANVYKKDRFQRFRALRYSNLTIANARTPQYKEERLQTKVGGQSPRRLTDKETKATTAAAIQEFDLNVKLPLDPILLLHDLGKRPDKDRMKNLFTRDTVHLFGVSGSGATLARRRWVLAQVLPPSLNFQDEDLFVRVLWTLRRSRTPLFVVIDEAQVTADNLKEYFRSDTGTDMHPILREMYRFFLNTQLFTGFILSGTGLSMKMVKDAVGSVSAKNAAGSGTRVFTDIGRFTRDDSSQLDYIRRYLTLSDNNSDRRLLERMVYWFSGRHRLTASLIELFIYSENVPGHRVLTSFAERLTGFKITEAIDLEDDEPPICPELSTLISHYRSIGKLDRVFNEKNRPPTYLIGEELIQYLVEVLMRWTLGSEPTTIAIERHMHEIIACGIGFLDKMTNAWEFKADENYPVYISEPLVVLSLSSLFQKHSHTMREIWMGNAFPSARTTSSLGYMFDQAILLVLMETFGGKFKPLGRLPLLLAFLHDPDGKPFLLPDIHMGPDVLCTLQDEETKELIILAVQAKVSPSLDARKWRGAIISVTPEFLYTVQKGGKRYRYARVSYPELVDDLTECLEIIVGPAVYTPIAGTYRSQLRSSMRAQQ
ncbi:hypothetical protein BU17DRAFT_70833 [Hysterangium stoloniferum]|nr:hypothetical protein BU17DRAFT_70833 [Hysterangium stoloniferum]